MDDVGVSTPGAGAVGGSTIYCTTAGADGNTVTTATSNVTAVAEVQTLTFYNGVTATAPSAATFIITFAAEACATTAFGDVDAAVEADCNANANLDGLDVVFNAGRTAAVLTWLTTNGDVPLVTCAGTTMYGGVDGTCTAVETTKGVAGTTFDFVDNDLSNNSIVTARTVQYRGATDATAGIPVTESLYQRWTYDSGDNLALGAANPAATEAQFEAGLAVVGNLTTDATVTYRTGALTTGVSYVSVG